MDLNQLKNICKEKMDYAKEFVDESFLNENVNTQTYRQKQVQKGEQYYRGVVDTMKYVLKCLDKVVITQPVAQSVPQKKMNESFDMFGPDMEEMNYITPNSMPNSSGGFTVQRWEDIKQPQVGSGMNGQQGTNAQDNILNLANADVVDDTEIDVDWFNQ